VAGRLSPLGNREAALALASAGIAIFPCMGGEASGDQVKRPLPNLAWRHRSTTDADKIERWWSEHPLAIPAIDLAKAGLITIDCDAALDPGDIDGVAWFVHLAYQHGLDIDGVPGTLTGRGGRHLIFRQPAVPLTNGRGSLPPKKTCGVDVRGAGGYVIAPGASLTDGRVYEPVGSLAEAPALPDWLEAILRAPGDKKTIPDEISPIQIRPVPALKIPEKRLSAYVQAAVDAEISALRSTPKGGRNNALNTSAFALGQMVGAGWLVQSSAESALEGAAVDNGLVHEDGWSAARKTIRSGLRAGSARPREPLAEAESRDDGVYARALIEDKNGTVYDAETGDVVAGKMPATVAPRRKTEATGELPAHLHQPPGLVGEIAAWIVATSRRPQAALALGAALTLVGTAAGRQLAGPTLSATHLYVLGLAPTGAGKDHPLQAIGQILKAARMGQHIGPSEFISMPAVINFLLRSPLSLCAMDEFAAFLKRINNRRASGFEAAVSKIMLTAWGCSFKAMQTPEWAGKSSVEIASPAMSIFGAATEEEFYGAMMSADQNNGVLNRFLVMPTKVRPPERNPVIDPLVVPDEITFQLSAIYGLTGELAAAQRNSSHLSPNPLRMTWGPNAEDLYFAIGEEVLERGDANPMEQPFLARTVEMAVRIATIVAVGRQSGVVEIDDLAFGRDLALWSASALFSGASENAADTDNQSEANRIFRIIRSHGGRITRSKLLRAMAHRVKLRDFNQLLDGMVEAETILRAAVETDHGPTTTVYLIP